MKGLIGDRFLKRFSGILKNIQRKGTLKSVKPGHGFDREDKRGEDPCKEEIVLEEEDLINIKERNDQTKPD